MWLEKIAALYYLFYTFSCFCWRDNPEGIPKTLLLIWVKMACHIPFEWKFIGFRWKTVSERQSQRHRKGSSIPLKVGWIKWRQRSSWVCQSAFVQKSLTERVAINVSNHSFSVKGLQNHPAKMEINAGCYYCALTHTSSCETPLNVTTTDNLILTITLSPIKIYMQKS